MKQIMLERANGLPFIIAQVYWPFVRISCVQKWP